MYPPLLELITGPAGSGKTYTLQQRIKGYAERGRKYATLTATTGIAAINLSGANGDTVTTINSELKYFDTNSLKDNFACKRLHNALKQISKKSRHLAIDEISMMDKEQLDLIYDALVQVNELAEVHNRGGLGLILSGDFCQLPPVKGEFCFNAKCWNNFKVTKLDKVYRQSDARFLEMLNAARCGDGALASQLICDNIPEITLHSIIDSHFEGTTIVPLNKYVDSFNKIRLDELLAHGKKVWEFPTFRWGRQYSEWNNIPEKRVVCKDAYVMILANDSPKFSYANGSCGHVEEADIDNGSIYINLKSNANVVRVRRVTRRYMQKELPDGYQPVQDWLSKGDWIKKHEMDSEGYGDPEDTNDILYRSYLGSLTDTSKMKNGLNHPYFDFLEEKWVVGEITYTPIRLAYASTTHKAQGLTLDRVQIDYSNPFFGEPSMSYVALSRCRTPEGLHIVGSRSLIEQRTNISSEILDWL